MIFSKIQRILKLYKLLWADDRLTDLEVLPKRIGELREQIDLLKSSIEVPADMRSEFLEWKHRTPIPPRPLVSVCIATYNRARVLTERSLASVLNQTYKNFEVIVVGDACTDDTFDLLSKIKDPRLRAVNLPERGKYPDDPNRRWMVAGSKPINEGLVMSQGDYITHLDDDDEYVPDRLEKLVEFAAAEKCDFIWHPFWWEDRNGNWEIRQCMTFTHSDVTTSSVFYRYWFKCIPWNVDAHLLGEPADWNRFRKIKYVGPELRRYPEPLLKHYVERNQNHSAASTPAVSQPEQKHTVTESREVKSA